MIEKKYLLEYNGMTFVDITKVNELQKENKHLLELQKDMDKQYEELENENLELRKLISKE